MSAEHRGTIILLDQLASLLLKPSMSLAFLPGTRTAEPRFTRQTPGPVVLYWKAATSILHKQQVSSARLARYELLGAHLLFS